MAGMVSKGENKGREGGGVGGEERENGSGSDEEDGDRSGRHGRGGIAKIGRKEGNKEGGMKQWILGKITRELENLGRKKEITSVGLEKGRAAS